MNETHIGEIWMLIKEYVDKKDLSSLSEKYIDVLADLGVSDKAIKEALGYDSALDDAIEYYLDQDIQEDDEIEIEDWEDE
jgi:hypothetical protein